MKKIEGKQHTNLRELFPEYTWNYIADSMLEGFFGEVLVNDVEDPRVAALTLPEHKIHILGGDADHPSSREYLSKLPALNLVMFGAAGWADLLHDVQPGKVIDLKRYAFSSEGLDKEHLSELKAGLPEKFRIERIDLVRARQIVAEKNHLTEDHLFGFASPEDFIADGFGYCALNGDQMVCIASSGAVCSKGIEVQVNTHKKYRGQGLATATCAALLLECLEKGIDPNWDAATENSAGLAEKLGYQPQGEYDVYFYTGSRFLVGLRNFLRWIRGRPL